MNHAAPHARTLAMIRLLHTLQPRRRRRRVQRIPPQQQPDAIRMEYFKAIEPVIAQARASFAQVRREILEQLGHHQRHDADVGGLGGAAARGKAARGRDEERGRRIGVELGAAQAAGRRAGALLNKAADHFAGQFNAPAVKEIAKRAGGRTSEFQRQQLDRQVRAAVGVPFSAVERPIRDQVEEFAAVNVDLIKSVPERYFDRLRIEIEEAFKEGMRPEDLAARFEEIYGIAENDAIRIAKDQIGKLQSELNQSRQKAMGLTGYTWRGMLDEKERPEHINREGVHFEWDDPPEDGHPGEPILCRCWPEPDFTPLLDTSSDEDEDAEEG